MVEQFELYGRESAEGALAAAAVVGAFNPGHDRQAQVVAGAPKRRSRTLFCSSAKNDSIAALSPQAPTRPIDPTSRVGMRGGVFAPKDLE